jgi:hypothetical protein
MRPAHLLGDWDLSKLGIDFTLKKVYSDKGINYNNRYPESERLQCKA